METKKMDKKGQAAVNKCSHADEDDSVKVVMRKPRHSYELSYSNSLDSNDGSCKSDDGSDGGHKKKKQVKWSESTDLRERLKVYRRSQMDIPLDYHHLAIEEQRERKGVEVWRSHVNSEEDDDNEEDNTEAQLCGAACGSDAAADVAVEVCGDYEKISPNYDSDDTDLNSDEDLERNLQVIKEETTRFTLYPAYSAAISVYEEWLSNPDNMTGYTDDQRISMTTQLSLYKRIVDIYRDWTRQPCTDIPRDSRFGEISSVLQEVTSLGQPPSCVSEVIREVLTDEENVQMQVDAYNNQVQEMIAALDITNKI